MTGLRRLRRISKSLIIFSFIWEVVTAIISLVCLITVAVLGGGVLAADRLIPAVGTLAFSGVVIWAIREGRKRRHRDHLERVATAEKPA